MLVLLGASPSLAAPEGLRRWWLPENFSQHGTTIDLLFTVIFIVTAAVGVAVFFFLIRYCIKYRYRPDAKAHFTHGNKKLELVWTIIPTILLLGLALWTKGSWDNYRESTTANDPSRARIMVIAEQFRWNVIYPGPDGKLGRYLLYPKTTDMKWPTMPPNDETITSFLANQKYFQNGHPFSLERYPGPAYLPPEVAKELLNSYVGDKNPLGKDFDDPDGKDDDWTKFPGRPIEVPKGRPIEIILSSKDVIHSFFLPDFRVKLDAVPGMRGRIFFSATKSSAEVQKASERDYTIEQLEELFKDKLNPPELHAVIPADKADTFVYTGEIIDPKDRRKQRKIKGDKTLADGDLIDATVVAGMRDKGVVKQVRAYATKRWDLVCEELCGVGHTGMQGYLVVLDPDEYARKYEGKSIATTSAPPAAPETPPVAPATPATSPAAPATPPAAPEAPAAPATTAPANPATPAATPATSPVSEAPSTPSAATQPATPATEPTAPAPSTSPATQPAAPATQPAG